MNRNMISHLSNPLSILSIMEQRKRDKTFQLISLFQHLLEKTQGVTKPGCHDMAH